MNRTDDAERMRVRAHQIWEREGRPQGREHEHWAEAARELAGEVAVTRKSERDLPELPHDSEIERLRRALYEPGEFSIELFGHEAPPVVPRTRPEALRQNGFSPARSRSSAVTGARAL